MLKEYHTFDRMLEKYMCICLKLYIKKDSYNQEQQNINTLLRVEINSIPSHYIKIKTKQLNIVVSKLLL